MLSSREIVDRLHMKQSEIDKTSIEKKVQTVETRWDALDEEEIESHDCHHHVLDERVRKLDIGQAEFVSLDELKQQNVDRK